MAILRPFRGLFYNREVVGDISRVIAPPYDIIDEAKKQKLQERSPYNIVRLILPRDEEEKAFWNTSAAVYRAWKRGEVLLRDEAPCLYLHCQTFASPQGRITRTGIIGALRCMELGPRGVLPHEMTFPRTRSQRLYLLRSCRANFSQVFMVFRDGEEDVRQALDDVTTRPPFVEFVDDEGVEHRMWRVEDTGEIVRIAGALRAGNLIIADGHHRYETALAFSKEDPTIRDPGHPCKFVSATLVRSQDPGLVILPVHRVLKKLHLPLEETYRRLERYFELQVVQGNAAERRGSLAADLQREGRARFIMVTGREIMRLVLRRGVVPAREIEGKESRRWKELDISILHALVLKEVMGLQPERLAENGELSFTPWESEALDQVSSAKASVAFLVRPTRMEDIWEIASAGERMPHKSSYFYPKLPSGLVIYDHESAFS
ncbi:MAG: DUF1015 domain-containing protein [Actinobacteria bacterium]|nr:DUF1015 domain-containing protein [Actinomycetota bacterium]